MQRASFLMNATPKGTRLAPLKVRWDERNQTGDGEPIGMETGEAARASRGDAGNVIAAT